MVTVGEKGIETIIVILGAVLILVGVLALAAGAGLIEMPKTDFFGMLEKLFGFLEKEVFLASKETREWFCQKDLQDAMDVCQIKPSQLNEYCDSMDEEKVGTCQDPVSDMRAFCKETFLKRDNICKNRNDFNSGCEAILKIGEGKSMKDAPFCK